MTFFSALHFLGCGVFCVYDGQGNIVRSIDILAQKEYNYEGETRGRLSSLPTGEHRVRFHVLTERQLTILCLDEN